MAHVRRRIVVLTALIAVAGVAACGAIHAWLQYRRDARTPCSVHVKGGSIDGEFPRIQCRLWATGRGELFYGIVTGRTEFDPNQPSVDYAYSWSLGKGGTLEVNGRPVAYSGRKRLLVLNAFGEMEEITLSEEEAETAISADASAVWTDIILKRVYQWTGELVDGRPNGHCTYADQSGRKAYEGDYLQGNRHGTWVYYRQDGTVRAELTYHHGRRDGVWHYFDSQGKHSKTVTWKDDQPLDTAVSDAGMGYYRVARPGGGTFAIGVP